MSAVADRVSRAVSAAEGEPLISPRERRLEWQVKWLAERLALAVMLHSELPQGIVLLDGRDDDRQTLKDDAGFDLWKRKVREALVIAMQKAELEE